ncbi:MAG: hypothetical protein JNL18_16720 [Planctomycetaceae bacterium]|uniref:Uncharacterized protein n=1 Tax=Lacipirellula limnantheis TaxID=2528024 RepID=A0A517TUE7_9BACT|nr:hypothetical protein [Lacipirellula limnantheis]MBL9164374.1 hypothetical protein [Planctomycetaceae bacterium]QDT71990.1 hypothetical protein I41_11550 [Lacipirellula limnantheis]
MSFLSPAMACVVAPPGESAESCSPTAKRCLPAKSPCRWSANAFQRPALLASPPSGGSDPVEGLRSAGVPISLIHRVRMRLLSLLGR